MINAVIVDDSKDAIDFLSDILKDYVPEVNVLGIALNVDSAFELINTAKPELVFLDIEIRDKTGFDLLKMFPKIDFKVIFITGYDNYAIEAFKLNVLHYLVKPVSPVDVIEAVDRLRKSKEHPDLNNLDLHIGLKAKEEKRIPINTENETKFIYLKDILFLKGEGSYSTIFLADGKQILISKLLKEMEKSLQSEEFYRVSKSYIVNMNHVLLIKHIDGGMIEMTNGSIIPIPRRKREEFTLRIMKFMT